MLPTHLVSKLHTQIQNITIQDRDAYMRGAMWMHQKFMAILDEITLDEAFEGQSSSEISIGYIKAIAEIQGRALDVIN